MHQTSPINGQMQARGKRVHDRHAHPVQAARYLVGIIIKLAARMQRGHNDFSGGTPLFMGADRYAAAIVGNGHGAVRVDHHPDMVAITRERLVDAVIDHFKDHVVQAGPVIGVADIHPRTLPHSLQSLQNLDSG